MSGLEKVRYWRVPVRLR
jgi:hypothetical protein